MVLYRVSVWKSEDSRRTDFLYVNENDAINHFNMVVVASLTINDALRGYGVAVNLYDISAPDASGQIPSMPKLEFVSSDNINYGRVIRY